jgi:uncharacterized protein YeeX (DUF496 family)
MKMHSANKIIMIYVEGNNMKKIAILVASVLVLGSFSTKAFAADGNNETTQPAEVVVSYKEDAGVTPDSLLYIIDKAVDDLRVLIANTEEKEAIVNADIAQERLGESEAMAEEGKAELAEDALEEYNEKITEATEKLQEVIVNNEEDADSEEESTDSKLEQSIADLEKAIQEVQQKSLVVLDNLKDVIPEESTKAVEEVIEEQTAHKEAVAKFVAERHEFNAAKKSLNMAKVDLKKVEKGGNQEDVKAAQDKLAAAQNEYMTAKTELHSAFQAKKAADATVEGSKEEDKTEETIQETTAVQEDVKVDDTAKVEEYNKAVEKSVNPSQNVKTNNGNGNGNGNKPSKIEKEKSAPGKSGEENGKSSQANGNGNKK